MAKRKTLFDREMQNQDFAKKYGNERKDFELEVQILQAIEDLGLTYEQFAKKLGTSKGNVSRDLKSNGLGRASLERIQKMAEALGMDCVTILLPKEKKSRRARVSAYLKKVS